MLVCNVSLRAPRSAIVAAIVETAAASETASGANAFAALVDESGFADAIVNAYLGEIMLETASASDSVSTAGAVQTGAVNETVTAADAPDATVPVAYATYDGLATNVTVSNGGLTALHHNTSTNSGVISTAFKSSGKYYFEVTLQTTTTASNYIGIMLSTWSSVFSTTQMTTNSTSVQLGGTGGIFSNGVNTGKTVGISNVGDVYSFAIDLTADLGWIRKNGGNWNGDAAANPATGAGGVTIAAGSFAPLVRFAAAVVSTDQMTGNFGQSSFAYTVPSGFNSYWPA